MCLHYYFLRVHIGFHFIISLYFIIGATFNELFVLFFIANLLNRFFLGHFFIPKNCVILC